MLRKLILMICLFVLSAPLAIYAAPGDVWVDSGAGTNQAVVHVDTGAQKLGAYQFVVTFDPSTVSVDTSKGNNGVAAGADGFVSAVNTDNSNGKVVVNGFDVNGGSSGSNLEVLKIALNVKNASGLAGIKVRAESLADEVGGAIGKAR